MPPQQRTPIVIRHNGGIPLVPQGVPLGVPQPPPTAWERFKLGLVAIHRVLMWLIGTAWLWVLVILSVVLLYGTYKFAWWFKVYLDKWFAV